MRADAARGEPWARNGRRRGAAPHITVSATSTEEERGTHERHSTGCDRRRRSAQRAARPRHGTGRRPRRADRRRPVQLAVGPGSQRRVQPVLELFGIQRARSLARGQAQPLGDGSRWRRRLGAMSGVPSTATVPVVLAPPDGDGGDVQLAGRGPRLSDVHRHGVRRRRSARVPDRLRHPGEHRPRRASSSGCRTRTAPTASRPGGAARGAGLRAAGREGPGELFGGQTGDEIDKFERGEWRPGPAARRCSTAAPTASSAACSSAWTGRRRRVPAGAGARRARHGRRRVRFHRAKRIEPGHEA